MYTTRNHIVYDVPKLVYRHDGMLDVPGEDSDAGVWRWYLDNLMNIWQMDHIATSLESNLSPWEMGIKLV